VIRIAGRSQEVNEVEEVEDVKEVIGAKKGTRCGWRPELQPRPDAWSSCQPGLVSLYD
jgi:hypothetical protein